VGTYFFIPDYKDYLQIWQERRKHPMFRINDYVVYNSTGVCQITDIINDKDASGNLVEYYILQPVSNKKMIIKSPVNNPKVSIRKVMSKEDAIALISIMPELETVWINDHRLRNQSFKAALKTGECEELAKLIKTLYLKREEVSVLGKKLTKADEDILKAAEEHLYEEFAIALNIPQDEVVSYIQEHVSE